MTERKFLSYVLTEGILLLFLGLAMLMLPKITTITFGLMLCLAFVIYGGYKTINAIFTRNYSRHYILNIFTGILLTIIGLLLFMAPMFNLILITSAIGIYFLLESISSFSFGIQTRNTFAFWWTSIIMAAFQLLLALIIILGLPTTAIWVIGILAGINFLFAGMGLISMYIASKYIY